MGLSTASKIKRGLYNKWVILLATVMIGCAAAWILYQTFFQHLAPKNETTADEYGTAFNGIVGTSITIIGLAFLVYAYRSQQRQAEYELINKLYESLLEDINSIQYRKKYTKHSAAPVNGQLLQGVEALYHYEADDDTNPNSVLNHLNLILLTFEQIITLVDNSIHQNKLFQEIMRDKVYWLFLAKIYWSCDKIYREYRSFLLRKNWGNAKVLFFKYEELTLAAFTTLRQSRKVFIGQDDSILVALRQRTYAFWEHYSVPETRRLPKLVTDLVKPSALREALLDSIERGPLLELRNQFYRFRHPPSEVVG